MRVGDVIDGKYRLVELLGESGMGIVYAGEREGTAEHVTLKILHSHTAGIEQIIEDCIVESTSVGALDSPHVVPVIGSGIFNSSPYIVRPHLPGADLGYVLENNDGPLHPSRVVPLITQACSGLKKALEHEHHHWNLTPKNLFVTSDADGVDLVKILDFGIAKIRDALAAEAIESTVSGTTLGLPRYMPMEQIRGVEDRDHRVDIYALGAILYELLTGFRPYEAESYTRLLLLIATTDPAPIQKKRPALGDDLAAVVHRALEREPQDRYQSFDELSEALAPLLSDISPEEPKVEVVEKLSRRESSKTLPDIPLSEHVKRAAKLYEERQTAEIPKAKHAFRGHPWRGVGIAVAFSVFLAVLIIGITQSARTARVEEARGSTPVANTLDDSHNGESWAARCSYHYLSKQYDEAETVCSRGFEETKEIDVKASLIYTLGRIAAARGDHERARQQYEKALMLDPDNPAILRRIEELGQ